MPTPACLELLQVSPCERWSQQRAVGGQTSLGNNKASFSFLHPTSPARAPGFRALQLHLPSRFLPCKIGGSLTHWPTMWVPKIGWEVLSSTGTRSGCCSWDSRQEKALPPISFHISQAAAARCHCAAQLPSTHIFFCLNHSHGKGITDVQFLFCKAFSQDAYLRNYNGC